MEYTFVLGADASIEKIEDGLRGVDGIAWQVANTNLRVSVPDSIQLMIEEQLFDAVMAGIGETANRLVADNEDDNANILCGALQSKLLDKYLPIALSSLPTGVVVEVDSIDDQLVMLRLRGPKECVEVVDRMSAWIMSKCAVGVRDGDQTTTAG
ncbi:hypothetical protein SH449x_003997 [Pirellulaceae bacterium SH449]